MRHILFGAAGFLVAAGALLYGPLARADGAVVVAFPKGETEIDTFQAGVPLIIGQTPKLKTIPDEVSGLKFARRAPKGAGSAEVDVPAGTVLYVAYGDGRMAKGSRENAERDGFAQVGPGHLDDRSGIIVYKKSYAAATHVSIKAGGTLGVVVIARKLEVKSGSSDDTPDSPAEQPKSKGPALVPDQPTKLRAIEGPTTKPALMQTDIHCMTVRELPSGLMLGSAHDAILTVLRGSSPTEVNFRFITAVGPQMRGARDDAVRFVHVRYPNWTVGGAELTTSERDVAIEGPSMGAALTTLLFSAIQGFSIDQHAAVTGDISANGRILEIGGVYAKLHGAEDAGCTIAVIPADNLSALINTEDFIGKGQVPGVQVLGADTIDDVIADVRADRGAKLTEAISLYGEVRAKIADSKPYLHSAECAEKLTRVLQLAPRHFSAKLLLMEVMGKRPKTLSVGASRYYVYAAVDQIMPLLLERGKEGGQMPPSTVVNQGLEDLGKLRAICDPNMIPVVDAWERYIRTLSSYESGLASPRNLETERQAVIDAMAKVDMNADLMQKMMKEGI